MNTLRTPRRARTACRAAVILTLAAGLGAAPGTAWARVLPPPTQSGAVSWGADNLGQLGNSGDSGTDLYGGVTGLGGGIAAVSAGYEHGLALKTDGTVWAWGGDQYGELGDGVAGSTSVPVQVPGLTGITQIGAGAGQNIALRSDGTVWQWGGGDPAICNLATAPQPVPEQVPGLTSITQIAAGSDFGLALRSDGTVWAWGCNNFGQLGVSMPGSMTPVQVPGLSRVISIAAGAFSAAAIERRNLYTTMTTLLAWGAYGLPGTDQITPAQVQGIDAPEVARISAGAFFMVAVGSDGSVWTWGDNVSDDLGVGAPGTQPVEVFGPGSRITQVSAGWGYVLALRSDGTVLAWGRDTHGELGDGTISSDSLPVQVAGLTGITQVSAGDGFGLAVRKTQYLTLGVGVTR
ncbi:MAG: RCC1 domain-containing protein [Streptosporangiaceae bacterium]